MPARVFATGTCLSVCLSVCHTLVLCLAEQKQGRYDSSKNSQGVTPKKVRNEGGLGFFDDFQPICRHISKTVHFTHKVTIGR